MRLDAVAQLRVLTSVVVTPPEAADDGSSYLIPEGATGAWQGKDGRIAVWSNGGWIFVQPKAGWRAWDEERFGHLAFDGTAWVRDAVAAAGGGSATVQRVIEFDHVITPSSGNLTDMTIPDGAQVIGVTGRVLAAVTGSGLTGWRLGVDGSDNRYGSGLGLAMHSYLRGLSGTPVTYYADTPLLVSAEGGQFATGTIRLALHVVELVPPRAT